jgi:hypothetical protein
VINSIEVHQMASGGGPRDYDHLFKLLIIGDSGK